MSVPPRPDRMEHEAAAIHALAEVAKRNGGFERLRDPELIAIATVRSNLALSQAISEWTLTLRQIDQRRNGR